MADNVGKQVAAQLSQRDRAAGWVGFGQKWNTERGDNILQTLYACVQPL